MGVRGEILTLKLETQNRNVEKRGRIKFMDEEHLEKACNWNEDNETITHHKEPLIQGQFPVHEKKIRYGYLTKEIICATCGIHFYKVRRYANNTKYCLDCKPR